MRHAILAVCFALAMPLPHAAAQDAAPPAAPGLVPSDAAVATVAVPAAADLIQSTRIVIVGEAKTAGEIRFIFAPESGAKKEIRATVTAEMSNQDAARHLAKQLSESLGDDYKVDGYEPDKISITAKKKGGGFRLTLDTVTANGLSVRFD